MEFDISGHSGCRLTVCRDNGGMTVLKSTNDRSYIKRLSKQAQKQQAFYQQQDSDIRTPKVLDISLSPSSCSVKMEFVYGQNFIEFFEYAGRDRLDSFVNTMLLFIEKEFERSSTKEVDSSVIRAKYQNVKGRVFNNLALADDPEITSRFKVLDAIFDGYRSSSALPVGACHGDLTLSNMLFNGSRVYLLDFLDSFIESPLMDIVKLRQDTCYGWSFLMFKRPYDCVRHQIILDYIDQRIVARFQENPFYRDNYVLFQLMNFLRILQYAHEPQVIIFLKEVIHQLIQEYETQFNHPAGG